jgi:hypothetical protein
MALGSTQPLNRNEYQEYLLGGKRGRCLGLTTLPPSCADCLEIWELQPPGTLRGLSRPVMGLLYLYLYLFINAETVPNQFMVGGIRDTQ